MKTSLKITFVLVIIMLAVNMFLWSHNTIKRSDLTRQTGQTQVSP